MGPEAARADRGVLRDCFPDPDRCPVPSGHHPGPVDFAADSLLHRRIRVFIRSGMLDYYRRNLSDSDPGKGHGAGHTGSVAGHVPCGSAATHAVGRTGARAYFLAFRLIMLSTALAYLAGYPVHKGPIS